MRSSLTVSLPAEITRELALLAKRSGKSRSQIVQEALRREISLHRFQRLRQKLGPKGQNAQLLTDEDVFKALS